MDVDAESPSPIRLSKRLRTHFLPSQSAVSCPSSEDLKPLTYSHCLLEDRLQCTTLFSRQIASELVIGRISESTNFGREMEDLKFYNPSGFVITMPTMPPPFLLKRQFIFQIGISGTGMRARSPSPLPVPESRESLDRYSKH